MGGARLSAVVLDTCAILWLAAGRSPRAETEAVIEEARARDAALVSPISAWEIAMKHARRPEELGLKEPPEAFFGAFVAQIGVRLARLDVAVLVRSTRLADFPDRDPADRMIVATALEVGARVVTGDRRILDHVEGALGY